MNRRHGAADEVERRGGVGPVVANQLLRFLVGRVQRTAADQWASRSATALVAVAGGAAVVGIDLRTLRGCAAAGRQADARTWQIRCELAKLPLTLACGDYEIKRAASNRKKGSNLVRRKLPFEKSNTGRLPWPRRFCFIQRSTTELSKVVQTSQVERWSANARRTPSRWPSLVKSRITTRAAARSVGNRKGRYSPS